MLDDPRPVVASRSDLVAAALALGNARAQDVKINVLCGFLFLFAVWIGYQNYKLHEDQRGLRDLASQAHGQAAKLATQVDELKKLEVNIEKIRVARAQDTNYFSQQNCRTSAAITLVMHDSASERVAVEQSIHVPPLEGDAQPKRIRQALHTLYRINAIRKQFNLAVCRPPKIDSPIVRHVSREPSGKH